MKPQELEDARLLWKMFYAQQCFKHAQAAAEHVLREKLEKDHPLHYPLVVSIHVLYGKPFRRSRVVGRINDDIVPPEHVQLHEAMLKYRDQVYAHSDADSCDVGDFGQANQVRVLRLPEGSRLMATHFHARYVHMPPIIDLCAKLRDKAEYHTAKLFKRYEKQVPKKIGEYAINIDGAASTFFVPVESILLKAITQKGRRK